MLLGIEYADGRRGSNVHGVSNGGVILGSSRSGGGPREAQSTYFCAPLPPPGDVRIYCALPAAGIGETVTVIDAAVILEASSRARELWPWEPVRKQSLRPALPVVPEDGWFASLGEPEDG